MTDFALYHIADWRDGELPETDGATHIVSQAGRNRAYLVMSDQVDEFYEWVAMTFCKDTDPMPSDLDWPLHEYLEEIDVSVKEI